MKTERQELIEDAKFILSGAFRLTLLIAACVGAVCLFVFWGSECWTSWGCPPRQECMSWSLPGRSGLNWFQIYKTCETPCARNEDCPAGRECVEVNHGPGPGPFCTRDRNG